MLPGLRQVFDIKCMAIVKDVVKGFLVYEDKIYDSKSPDWQQKKPIDKQRVEILYIFYISIYITIIYTSLKQTSLSSKLFQHFKKLVENIERIRFCLESIQIKKYLFVDVDIYGKKSTSFRFKQEKIYHHSNLQYKYSIFKFKIGGLHSQKLPIFKICMDLEDNSKSLNLQDIIKKYDIDEEDQESFNQFIRNQDISQCLELVNEGDRMSLKNDLQNYLKFQASQKKQALQKQSLRLIFKKYGLDQKKDFANIKEELNQNNISIFVNCAKKKHRDNMERQLHSYFKEKNKDIVQDQQAQKVLNGSNSQIFQELPQILKQFDIQENKTEICLQSLQQKNIDKCVSIVQFSYREQFKRRITRWWSKLTMRNPYKIRIKIDQSFSDFEITKGAGQLSQNIKDKFNIDPSSLIQYTITLNNEKIIYSLEQIFTQKNKDLLVQFVKKVPQEYEYNSSNYQILLSPSSSESEIRHQIKKEMVNKFKVREENIQIDFQKQGQLQNLSIYKKKYGALSVKVSVKVQVVVTFKEKQSKLKMKLQNSVLELKTKIQKQFNVPQHLQTLQIKHENGRFFVKQSFQSFQLDKFSKGQKLQIELTNHFSFQFFGFHKNLGKMDFKTYKKHCEQRQINSMEIFQSINQKDEKSFLNLFLNYFFSHKHESIQIINNFKHSIIPLCKIWTPPKPGNPRRMNQSFLMMYLLQNSSDRISIQIMKSFYESMPLPLVLKKFKHIFSKSQKIQTNKNIFKAIPAKMTICSVGLHNQNNFMVEKGKTQLINNLFGSNFCLHKNRHEIIEQIPFISYRIINKILPVCIVDIPFDCDEKIKKSIIQSSDLIILHSWKSEQDTKKYIDEQINKREIKKNCIVFFRDQEQPQIQFISFNDANAIKLPNFSNESIQQYNNKMKATRNKLCSFLIEQLIKFEQINNFDKSSAFLRQMREKRDYNQLKNLLVLKKDKNRQIQINTRKKDSILLIGYSGVGKSTLFNLLLGHKLQVSKYGSQYFFQNAIITQNTAKIAKSRVDSQTSDIKIAKLQKQTILIDCPGFSDSRGYQTDIINCESIKTVFSKSSSIKIILVLSRMNLQQQKFTKVKNIIRKMSQCFKNLNQNTFKICCTHASKDWTQDRVRQRFKQIFNGLLQSSYQKIKQNQSQFYKFLIKQCPIFLLYSPKKEEIYTISEQLQKKIVFPLEDNTKKDKNFQFKYEAFNFISSQSKVQIQQFIQLIKEQKQLLLIQNSSQKKVLEGINQKIIQIQNGEMKAGEALTSLGIGTLLGGGFSVTLGGVSYVVATGVARYGGALVATAVTQSVLAGTSLLAGASQAIAYITGPIGMAIGGSILAISAVIKFYKSYKEKKIIQQENEKNEAFAKEIIVLFREVIYNSIKKSYQVLYDFQILLKSCKKMTKNQVFQE